MVTKLENTTFVYGLLLVTTRLLLPFPLLDFQIVLTGFIVYAIAVVTGERLSVICLIMASSLGSESLRIARSLLSQ